MLVLGIILLVLGWSLGISILYTLGLVLIVLGALLALVGGGLGYPVMGRNHWY